MPRGGFAFTYVSDKGNVYDLVIDPGLKLIPVR
jgi:hypothetical protein